MLTWTTVFPYTVAVLELVAGLVYFLHRDYRLGFVWLFVGLANLAFAGVRG